MSEILPGYKRAKEHFKKGEELLRTADKSAIEHDIGHLSQINAIANLASAHLEAARILASHPFLGDERDSLGW